MVNEDLTPASPSAAWNTMSPVWDKVETVLAGTAAMRAKGTRYMPRHEEERERAYKERLDRAVLYNISSMTLESWVGRPFSDPVKLIDVPEEMGPVLADVDQQGNAVGVFARRWFREGLAKALAHILVDFPAAAPVEAGRVRTLADDLAEGRRPYWCFVRPENLLFASAVIRDGREVLTQVRIRETHVERDGWGERTIHRIRVIAHSGVAGDKAVFSIWEMDDRQKWFEAQAPQVMDIDEIPLVTFYADRSDFMTGKPPLEDIVDLNIDHWQSRADQKAILTVARFPILAASGVVPEEIDKVLIGPQRILSTPDPSGKWYYVEHGGAAISAGREDLRDLEEQMAHYGAEYLRKRPGSESATARALDSAEATSPLEDSAIRFNDALARAMDVTGKWMKIEEPGRVEVPIDLGPETVQGEDFQALHAARDRRDLSREQYLKELRRRGTLADDFDPEADLALLTNEVVTGVPDVPTDPEQ